MMLPDDVSIFTFVLLFCTLLYLFYCTLHYVRVRAQRYSWRNRHVFITGGSEGVGFALAKILVVKHHAAHVTLFSRTPAKLAKAKAELLEAKAGQTKIHTISGDVASFTDVESAMKQAVEDFAGAPIDCVVAAAGMSIPKYFEDLTGADFEKQMAVNYMGVVHAAQAFLSPPTSVSRKFIAVSSGASAVPFIGYAAYAPSKAAVRAFCDCLRNEFVDEVGTAIHICFPPDMDTPGFSRENETKPPETKSVWPEMFNEVFAPDSVANSILDGAANGDYHLHSPDTFLNLLCSRGWGHYPRNYVLVEIFLAPVFVLLHEAMVWMMDRCVQKHNHHGKRREANKASPKKTD